MHGARDYEISFGVWKSWVLESKTRGMFETGGAFGALKFMSECALFVVRCVPSAR